MGLDHWLYKIKKADPELVRKIDGMRHADALALSNREGTRWELFLARIGEPGEPDVSDLADCADEITLIKSRFDDGLFKDRHGIPAEAVYCGGQFGGGYAVMHYVLDDDDYRVEVDDAEIGACSHDVKVRFYVCEAIELRQWRKRYDIQDAVYSRHDVENCGFHRIDDDETLNALEDLDPNLIIPRLRDGEGIYYHEWY